MILKLLVAIVCGCVQLYLVKQILEVVGTGQPFDESHRLIGRFAVTNQDADKGAFKTPSLRNAGLRFGVIVRDLESHHR